MEKLIKIVENIGKLLGKYPTIFLEGLWGTLWISAVVVLCGNDVTVPSVKHLHTSKINRAVFKNIDALDTVYRVQCRLGHVISNTASNRDLNTLTAQKRKIGWDLIRGENGNVCSVTAFYQSAAGHFQHAVTVVGKGKAVDTATFKE